MDNTEIKTQLGSYFKKQTERKKIPSQAIIVEEMNSSFENHTSRNGKQIRDY